MADQRSSVLDLIPMWLRSRWPLKRFYWQQEDIDRARQDAAQLKRDLGWD